MKQEYLLGYEQKWWHFFVKPMYGLCFRQKDGSRFSDLEILLKDVDADFCALSFEKMIHVVCQDREGSILYLCYDGENWKKTVILESKTGKAVPKFFKLLPIGKYINLFYVIEYKEKHMLVHQILDGSDKPPFVVDYITLSTAPYCIAPHISTDFTVTYENEHGICGSKLFKWSKKDYGTFTAITPGTSLFKPPFILVEPNDTCNFIAPITMEQFKNLVFFKRNAAGSYTEPITLYLDCDKEAAPILFVQDDKLFASWIDYGSIMSSYSTDGGEKWSKPIKYVRNSSIEPILYCFCINGALRHCYGFSQNNSITFYAAGDLLSAPPSALPEPQFKPKGSDAAEFARQAGFPVQQALEQEPVLDSAFDPADFISRADYKKEMQEMKRMLSNQNDIILELLRRLNKIENDGQRAVPIAEDEDAIDDIVAGNNK